MAREAELWDRAAGGDTAGATALLDAGADPLARDRLSTLAAGRTTVFGVPCDGELSVEITGGSLSAVLREHLLGVHELDAWEVRQPSNRGAGLLDDADVEASRERVAWLDALIRRL